MSAKGNRAAARAVLALVLFSPFPSSAAESSAPPPVRVTYISGASIYVDAGRELGLLEGDSLQVVRDGEVVSVLTVSHLSARRASCEVVDGNDPPRVGDQVQLPFRLDPGLQSPDLDRAASDSLPGDARSQEVPGIARISLVDQSTVYVDAGQRRGLRTGDVLRVVNGTSTVAELVVTDLSSDRAACVVANGVEGLQVGDLVRIPIVGVAPVGDSAPVYDSAEIVMAVPAELTPDPETRRRRRSDRRVRGRVGVRYLTVNDPNGTGDYSQPALDLRLDGNDLAAKHLDLAVDVRTRRTYRPEVDVNGEVEDQTRVYRASTTVHNKSSRARFTLGRQFSPALSSVSTFDGLLADFHGVHWSTGAFWGTQPDPLDYGYSSDIQEYGTFFQLHNREGSQKHWSLTTGAIGSYFDGIVNREFLYLQSLYAGRRVSFYASQEIDYNRDWKLLAGEDKIEPTSTFAQLGVRVGKGTNLRAGYDNRRNVRLYRDLITPETEFDDGFREGAWVGITQRFGKRFRIGLDAKQNTGSSSGDATSYTLTTGASQLTAARLSLYYRLTRYANDLLEGWLHSLNWGVSLTRIARLNFTGGLRKETDLVIVGMTEAQHWYGLGMDFNVGRRWFLQLSGEHTEGELDENNQSYFSMTYRF